MNDIKCVALDDEPIALDIISSFCRRLGNIDLKCFVDPEDALKSIESISPDLVFLDIEMNEYNGIQIAKTLKEDTFFIFTTAYLQYAMEGYNLDAVDFLHKPFSFERFQEAVEKARRRIDYNNIINKSKELIVKQEYNNVPVQISQILYIEGMENYSKIIMKSGQVIIAHNSLKNISDSLTNNEFIRIHKSYIVPRTEIKSYTRQNVFLSNNTTLPVGRKYVEVLFKQNIS